MSRTKVIRWHSFPIDLSPPASAQGLEHLPRINEAIEWGPQHVDLDTQHLMRCCYHREPLSATPDFVSYSRALGSGDDVCFWCEPILGSCLSVAWVLETLSARDAVLRNSFLVLSPGRSDVEVLSPDSIQHAFAEKVPTLEVLDPLVGVRRQLASDGGPLAVDLSVFPQRVGNWVAVAQRLADFLPDERGLDIVDRLLLNQVVAERDSGNEWPSAAEIIGRAYNHPEGHSFGPGQLWERLLQLSGFSPLWPLTLTESSTSLLEMRAEGRPNAPGSHFALTRFGEEVRSGHADALPTCPFVRWVGGREVSRHRPLRR